jgi:hypothetical protein
LCCANWAELELASALGIASPKGESDAGFLQRAAGALLAGGRSFNAAKTSLIKAAAAIEGEAFSALASGPDLQALDRALQARGWTVTWQRWPEPLELDIGEALLARWFGPQAAYRQQLQPSMPATDIDGLAQLLRGLLGQRLPQRLQHQLLIAQRRPSDSGSDSGFE